MQPFSLNVSEKGFQKDEWLVKILESCVNVDILGYRYRERLRKKILQESHSFVNIYVALFTENQFLLCLYFIY